MVHGRDSGREREVSRKEGEKNETNLNVHSEQAGSSTTTTYAERTTPITPAQREGEKPVYIRQRDIPNVQNNMATGEELYLALDKVVDPQRLAGVQKIRGLWRIYIDSKEARIALISSGILLRGSMVSVHDRNPFISYESV